MLGKEGVRGGGKVKRFSLPLSHYDEDKLPIDMVATKMANEFDIAPLLAALNGGEDYELLFTISQKDYEAIKENQDISVIGHIAPAEKGRYLITNAEQAIEIIAQGWNTVQE